MDPYKVLGIERNADPAEVKAAFRQLAMRFHPDISREVDAPQRYEEIRKAADEILNRVGHAFQPSLVSVQSDQDVQCAV